MWQQPTFVIFATDVPLSPSRPPAGGAEVATVNLAKALARAGKKVVLAGRLTEPESTSDGVTYWDLGQGYDVNEGLRRAMSLGEIHVLAASMVPAIFSARGLPGVLSRVLIWHMGSVQHVGFMPETVSHAADCIVCVSEAQRYMLVQAGADRTRTEVIFNGVDASVFHLPERDQRDFKRLVFVGVLIYEKGIHWSLQSYGELLPQFPGLKLDAIGRKGGWKVIDDRQAELESQLPGLKFHGQLPPHSIADVLKTAGLLILPSVITESAGLVLLEAQACGCPAMCFRLGGMPEYIEDGVTGKVIPEVNQAALTAALRSILGGNQLREYSKNCHDVAARRSWDQSAIKMVALCESISRGHFHRQSPDAR